MNWILEHKLKKLASAADPTPEFSRALERRIRSEIGHPLWWIKGWKVAVSSVTVVSLLGSGTGVYAYSSNDVTPDHPLYGLRTAIEKVETRVAQTPVDKARVRLKHLARRVDEQKVMQAHNKPVPKQLIQEIEKKLDKQIDEDTGLPESSRDELDTVAGTIKAQHEDLLEKDPVAKEGAKEGLERINKKIENLDAKRKTNFVRKARSADEQRSDEKKTDEKEGSTSRS